MYTNNKNKESMGLENLTINSSETKKLGKLFSQDILKYSSKKQAVIIGLEGNLGSGKTCFLQGFASGLGIKEKITSPTFVIMKKYKLNDKKISFSYFYHIDCYRIKKPKELLCLGFKKIISEPQNIIAIEWADQIKNILPKKNINIKFIFIDKNKRKIKFSNI